MFYIDRDTKASMVIFSSALPSKGVKGQRKSKFGTISNGKNNSVNVFYMDRDAKVSTLTSSYELPLRGQRSKKVKI